MKAKILIVDDSSLARRTMRQLLEELGHTVEDASDGIMALEKFFISPPDLVVLDLVMTGMYGVDVLNKMRELNPATKVIIATADVQQSTADQVRSAGAKGILNKPVTREKFRAILDTVLGGGEKWS
jgi:two-component system, chemotaxis family, chemotaxis protein CheY